MTSEEPARDGSPPVAGGAALVGPVLVVGAGLVGGSVAMALTRAGVETYVTDADPTVAHVAASRGAGSDRPPPGPVALVVVATPPDHLAGQIAAALAVHREAVVTDVGSVKARPLAQLRAQSVDLARYVGSHPMAGSERSGPLAADPDLFRGRSWAVVPHDASLARARSVVVALAQGCGATVVELTPTEHDAAVARTSHLPHLLAVLAAGRLGDAPSAHLALCGQGVRDVTRVAAGDPDLWRQILAANAEALTGLLAQVRADIDTLLVSLATGDRAPLQRLLESGVAGTTSLPGKHGQPAQTLQPVTVAIPDSPGALARLFADAGAAGVNIEDLRIDHDPARAFGLVQIDVASGSVERLLAALRANDWSAHR